MTPGSAQDGRALGLDAKVIAVGAGWGETGPDLSRLGDVLARRVVADPDNVEQGLVRLVLSVVELLRQLMERQAVRRVDEGDLTDEQVERVGLTLMRLERRMADLTAQLALTEDDLTLDLGPYARLLG